MSEQETSVGRWWSPAHTAWFSAQIYVLLVFSVLLALQAAALGTFVGFWEVVPHMLFYWLNTSAVLVFLLGFMEIPWPVPRWSPSLPVACATFFLGGLALGALAAARAEVPFHSGLSSSVGVALGVVMFMVPFRWIRKRRRSAHDSLD